MHEINEFLKAIDRHLGGSDWFIVLLLGVGLYFTIFLLFPQVRYFKYAIKIVKGKFDRDGDEGDTSHFQALATALSGTVGTGNIAGVALAIHIGGPSALFWMLVTAMIGMTTKFVEVTMSHKYREKAEDGTITGGPMYYMKKRLNFNLPSGKKIKTGHWLAAIFAVATVFSSFGTGNLPQINSISNSLFDTFGIEQWMTGAVLALLLGFIIIGGIKRIAKVTEKLVPGMALIYFLGVILVIFYNYENILPAISSIFSGLFSGSAATGGFLGAGVGFAMNRGVNRGLFSNEAGQGSAPIAHAAAKAHEPVSEGLVALLEPFIDTIIICSLTGLAILSSGVWQDKFENQFQEADIIVLNKSYSESNSIDIEKVAHFLGGSEGEDQVDLFNGELIIEDGKVKSDVTILHNRSFAEDISVSQSKNSYSGIINVVEGKLNINDNIRIDGKSLIQSAPLTNEAFTRSWIGEYGKLIVSIGILLFAFSTAISWSYYGSRAIVFLFGIKAVKWYTFVYVIGFFFASFIDTTIIWTFSGITIALMTIPNLVGIFLLQKEMKDEVRNFWSEYKKRFPKEKSPRI